MRVWIAVKQKCKNARWQGRMEKTQPRHSGNQGSTIKECVHYLSLIHIYYSLLVGEIDLILREPDGTLVFCEVKTRQPDSLTTLSLIHI